MNLPRKLHERGWILQNLFSDERCWHCQESSKFASFFANDLANPSIFAVVNFGFRRASPTECKVSSSDHLPRILSELSTSQYV